MKKNKFIYLLVVAFPLFLCLRLNAQQVKGAREIEKVVRAALDSAYASNVQIVPYDTVRNRPGIGMFSGVVVSAEGHILTVAHATKPNEIYQVRFPDGSRHLAVGKGKMAIKLDQGWLDMAMIRILKPGRWPFAKMGSNSGMKAGQLCLSISFPGSFNLKSQPNLRLGQINDPNTNFGYFETSCKMEPGDSGGGLFDSAGRLLGLHSWIQEGEGQNYEVPVDLYRKYWSALNVPKDYKVLPEADDFVSVADVENPLIIRSLQEMVALPANLAANTLSIESKRAGKTIRILGTVVNCKVAGKRQSYLVSKSSMVADTPVALLNGKISALQVLKRNKENDLVLMVTNSKTPVGIPLKDHPDSLVLSRMDLGKFLVSPDRGGRPKVGVLSTTYINMPLLLSVGYFGANARFIDQKITITQIMKGSPAENYLQNQDQVTAINGERVSQPSQYGVELKKYAAGDSITVDLVRGSVPIQVKMYLPAYPVSNHVVNKFEGGRSARSDGFSRVLIQDAAINAEECGGPVADTDGKFYGINIARHSRTSTVVMPVDVIQDFIYKEIKNENK